MNPSLLVMKMKVMKMNKRTPIVLIVLLVLLLGVTAFAESNEKTVLSESQNNESTTYEVNENGITYGRDNPLASAENQEQPQLIAAIGTNGEEGYVYAIDLEGEQPNSPEEALIYMKELNTSVEEAKEAGYKYLRYIPLYESDGVTVIGEFGISYPNMESIYE